MTKLHYVSICRMLCIVCCMVHELYDHGKATFKSSWHFAKKMKTNDNAECSWCREYGDWTWAGHSAEISRFYSQDIHCKSPWFTLKVTYSYHEINFLKYISNVRRNPIILHCANKRWYLDDINSLQKGLLFLFGFINKPFLSF